MAQLDRRANPARRARRTLVAAAMAGAAFLATGLVDAAAATGSGHGGSWGVMKDNFETALKVGKPVARQAVRNKKRFLASECPLAGLHIAQGIEKLEGEKPEIETVAHPIILFARAYGIAP